jgi:uronate dehydrogenase
MKLVLLTGAAGGVGGLIRPLLRPQFRLRLSDRAPISDLTAEEEDAPADLGDMAALREAVRGVDGIIHLGGYSVEADFATVHAANIIGATNLFEAARLEGVRRIVFASSNHVVGFYKRTERLPVDVTVRPDSRYGLSKAYGEALASLYADRYGAEVVSIRIGHITPQPVTVRDLAIWLSPRDFCQLLQIGLTTPDPGHTIIYGMSDNQRAWWDNSAAFRLGYQPQDRSEDYAAAVLAADSGPTGDPRVDLNQGGAFCVAEGPAGGGAKSTHWLRRAFTLR